MERFFKYIDVMADDEAPIHRINLDGETEYKSTLGGCCTLTIAIIFFLVLAKEAQDVISKEYPVSQKREVKDYYQEPVSIS